MDKAGEGDRSMWSKVKVICTDKEGEWSMVVRGHGHLRIRQGKVSGACGQGSRSSVRIRKVKVNGAWWSGVKVVYG